MIGRSVVTRSFTETENPLHGAFIGLERIAIARDGIGNPLQKTQRGIHILVPVKWHKAARE